MQAVDDDMGGHLHPPRTTPKKACNMTPPQSLQHKFLEFGTPSRSRGTKGGKYGVIRYGQRARQWSNQA